MHGIIYFVRKCEYEIICLLLILLNGVWLLTTECVEAFYGCSSTISSSGTVDSLKKLWYNAFV